MKKLVYRPGPHDPHETVVAGHIFLAGQPRTLPDGWDWLFRKLSANPFFEVVEDKPAPVVDVTLEQEVDDSH